jgi:hypothetical protein
MFMCQFMSHLSFCARMSKQQTDSKKHTRLWITEAEAFLQVAENLLASRDDSCALFSRLDPKTNQTKRNALTRITTFNFQARYLDFKCPRSIESVC